LVSLASYVDISFISPLFSDTFLPMSYVKDASLAEQGRLNLEIAEKHMGALLAVREEFKKTKPFKGLTIGMALHVTKETGVLVRTLTAGGAKVAITGCNPLSTQDDIAAALAEEKDVLVWAYKGESREDYYKFLTAVIETKPDITIDDGCDLVTEIHVKHPELLKKMIGGCEETTTGIIRLKAMQKEGVLKCPMIAVNDNKTKHLMHNTKQIAFCFDHGKPKRARLYPAYKANRKPESIEDKEHRSERNRQINLLRNEYLPAIGFKNVFWQEGYEADDLIASIVRSNARLTDIAILSSDKDLYQLLSPRVFMWNRGKKTTLQSFYQEWGIKPDRWAEVKAMAGCTSDNIEGIDGVGEKTAIKFLNLVLRALSHSE
jgi:hypothetical protein